MDVNIEAVRIGQSHGLGEPLGAWRREVVRPRGVWVVFGPVLAVLAVVVALLISTPGMAAVPILFVVVFVVGVYALAVRQTPRIRTDHWLYGYADGLVEISPRRSAQVLRWDEVTDVVDRWDSPNDEAPAVLVFQGWVLRTADDRFVLIDPGYRNADLIQDRAVSPVVARRVEAIRGGAVVTWGGARVNKDGIIGGKDKAVTPWAAIKRVELRPGHVRVRLVSGRSRRYHDDRDPSGQAVFCRLLLALGLSATCKEIR